MMTHHHSAQLIIEMRSLAKELFKEAFKALPPTGSNSVLLHPRIVQLICLNAVRDAAYRNCQTVLAPDLPAMGDASIAATELLELAENASPIKGSIAIVRGRTKRGPCNKQLALGFALAADRSPLDRPWIFLSGTTGHRECPYQSAGAIVDAGTYSWIGPFREHAQGVLTDPTSLFAASGDLLLCGPPASYAISIDLVILA
ncbi:hypothetical protein [Rhizobium sp. BK376]|uniref:hypothetical protein n=1 Tax=Rhizobium sp. BK376 TaxID=2512149 RepID=UPI00104FC8D9|nr:hypothetical protein [Rhizobium sp. BK376]TCR80739.1 hypothetical protein EV561_11316 [Rhizobium sp. BK376]